MPRHFYIPWVPAPRTLKRISRLHTWVYRKTRGFLGGRMDGLDMLLLTTTGRRSGIARTQPLPYFVDGDRHLLIASYGGGARNPDWFHNLVAEPNVTLQVKGTRLEGQARPAAGAEREALWRDITREHPRYLAYQATTQREIPVVIVEPRAPGRLETAAKELPPSGD